MLNNTMLDTINDDATEEPTPVEDGSEAPDDLGDITADEYDIAAEILAEEAAQSQEPTTEADGTPREQRYRQRAHDAEAERDQLRDLVDSMRRSEIQRFVADQLADPADLFRDGLVVADLIDDAGHIDPVKLSNAVDRVLAEHPHWRKPIAPYRGPMFSGSTNTRGIDTPAKGFADAFAPKRD